MTEQEEMAYFRAHGWEAWPCPMTMVPLFDAVRAGVPDSYTDSQPELAPIPKEYVDEKNAPVAGHTFLVYRDIALAFRRALVGKDRD